MWRSSAVIHTLQVLWTVHYISSMECLLSIQIAFSPSPSMPLDLFSSLSILPSFLSMPTRKEGYTMIMTVINSEYLLIYLTNMFNNKLLFFRMFYFFFRSPNKFYLTLKRWLCKVINGVTFFDYLCLINLLNQVPAAYYFYFIFLISEEVGDLASCGGSVFCCICAHNNAGTWWKFKKIWYC